MKAPRKLIRQLHLWLGLVSGLLVFVIAITGCIYAFQEEIQTATQPYRFVKAGNLPFLPPSQLIAAANEKLPDKKVHAVMYQGASDAAKVIYYSFEDNYYYFVYVNPYSGKVLKVKNEFADFFRIVLDGHFYLWLPAHIGQPVVASATLVFFVMLVSGIILWWPRNRKGLKKKFSFRWKAGWKRKNYDLHSVAGFYICWLALVFVLTGLVWGFTWFRDGLFIAASGGESYVDYYTPTSDTTALRDEQEPGIDRVWAKMVKEYPAADWIEVHPPENQHGSIAANANPDGSTYWQADYRYFDQYTLQELEVDHIWNRFKDSTKAELLMRMNYDIHVGSILGLPGKILAFLVSLTIASLPVTGIVMWIGRSKKEAQKTYYQSTKSTSISGNFVGSPEVKYAKGVRNN